MKILAVQNRMGIGDTVIFLPFIKAISKKYNSPVSLLVRENSKATEFLHQTNYINKILILERDKKLSNKHGGFFGTLSNFTFALLTIVNTSCIKGLTTSYAIKNLLVFQSALLVCVS